MPWWTRREIGLSKDYTYDGEEVVSTRLARLLYTSHNQYLKAMVCASADAKEWLECNATDGRYAMCVA